MVAVGMALPILSEAPDGIDAYDRRRAMFSEKPSLLAGAATDIQDAFAVKRPAHLQLGRPFDEPVGG